MHRATARGNSSSPAAVSMALAEGALVVILGVLAVPGTLGALIEWRTKGGLEYWCIISSFLLMPAAAITQLPRGGY